MSDGASAFDTRSSLGRESYFVAAYALLAESGCDGLTIAALCERLGVTKGSFYHHFPDMPAFVSAFAKRWEAWSCSIIEAYLAEPDLMRRLELSANSHIVLMTGAEPAIRAWARTEPVIAESVAKVDRLGDRFGRESFTELTGDAETGEMLTRMIVSVLVGMQQRKRVMDPDRLVEILDDWTTRCLKVRTSLVTVDGRLRMKVLGPTGEPIPRYRSPALLPTATDDAFHRAVDTAVLGMFPTAGNGREAWFGAAHGILAERGSDGVTVAALCERLGVTKGSFHHHFATMTGFLEALAEQWSNAFDALLDVYAAEADPRRRVELIYQGSLTFRHPAETAWRAWGRTNPVVGAALARVERRGEQLTAALLTELLGDTGRGALLAEAGIGLVIGLQIHEPPLDADTFGLTMLEWLRRWVGLEAGLSVRDGLPSLVLAGP